MILHTRKWIGILLLILGVGIAVVLGWQSFFPADPLPTSTPEVTAIPSSEPVPEASPEAEPTSPVEVDGLPVGKLVITPERQGYADGDLTLRIPALRVVRSIYNGVDSATLSKGVGLYDYAQLPGEGNRNVSLAGHRNGISNGKITDHAPFYYIDTLAEGDYLYLTDDTSVYRYLWESCVIVEADDWSPIYTTGTSCLTLTSCHPIGISDHRIVVRGILDEIFPYDKNFDYLASGKEATS